MTMSQSMDAYLIQVSTTFQYQVLFAEKKVTRKLTILTKKLFLTKCVKSKLKKNALPQGSISRRKMNDSNLPLLETQKLLTDLPF